MRAERSIYQAVIYIKNVRGAKKLQAFVILFKKKRADPTTIECRRRASGRDKTAGDAGTRSESTREACAAAHITANVFGASPV